MIRLPLDDYSIKIRTGDPIDDEEDLATEHWAGIIPIESRYGAPVDAADLVAGILPSAALLDGATP